MNHAGNPMSDTVNQPRAFEILTAEPVKKRRKPRDWSDDEKGQLVAETLLPGANVSAIARSAGVDPSQLYGWRRKALSSGAVTPLPETTGSEVRFARVDPVASSVVEIVIGDILVRAGGDVAPEHLAKVLRAVRLA
jgi:transposase